MNRFKHNTERWLRNQAKIYTTRGNTGMACVFESCADDYAKREAEVEALRGAAVHLYNSGYHAGHHDTVEGGYVDIHSNDMDSYHAEEVAELLAALVGEEGR